MVKKISSDKKFYYVQCGDWDSVTIADNHLDACMNAVDRAKDIFNEEIQYSDVIVACDCMQSINEEKEAEQAFLVEKVLERLSYEH